MYDLETIKAINTRGTTVPSLNQQQAAQAANDNTPPAEVLPRMDTFRACMLAEGVEEADEETRVAAWQFLIDTGVVWQLQGSYGRMAKSLILAGICHAPQQKREG